eukprot:CAMPEP_0183734948 /NCGR_PEP_ID=MMETSP0737-20130205/45290_1 /TAXON_ID=385413 /ORGANISM="Thalassiosira miniscula, Strain CCMP1093" /LENGTH=220 /DNA_ID=CAMNT_0025968571 /DNA_START=128 /DNA_END=786 /DNA_ORIENTATION=+
MSGYYNLAIPILAVALAYLAIPPIHDGKINGVYHISGRLCDIWTFLSSIVVLFVWAICDVNFDGTKILLSEVVSAGDTLNNDACDEGECNTSDWEDWEVMGNQSPLETGMHSIDQVSDAIYHHCWMTSFILGTAMALELLQVIAHRIVTRRSQEEKNDERSGGQHNSIYILFGWHDSECLLMVYALLFFTHVLMWNDRAGETFGLIFAEPIAARAGLYRP